MVYGRPDTELWIGKADSNKCKGEAGTGSGDHSNSVGKEGQCEGEAVQRPDQRWLCDSPWWLCDSPWHQEEEEDPCRGPEAGETAREAVWLEDGRQVGSGGWWDCRKTAVSSHWPEALQPHLITSGRQNYDLVTVFIWK